MRARTVRECSLALFDSCASQPPLVAACSEMHENMYFAEAHAMEMLSDRVVQRAEKLLRPRQRRQQQTTETVVTTAGGVVARTLRSVASSSNDEPLVAEGADLLHGLSQADVDRLLTTGSSSEPAAPTPPAVETLPPPVQGRALPAPRNA